MPERRGAPEGAHKASPARVAAARVLVAVDDGAHAEDQLASSTPRKPEDRAMAWHLVLGVLRHRGQVDAALREVVSRPLGGLDPAVRAVLRLGTFELLFGETARHAAVDQAVETARVVGAGRASGLVNAALRRVALPAQLSRADRLDHPAWLVERWDARFGAEATERWCLANNQPPPLVLAARDDVAALAAALAEVGVRSGPAQAGGQVIDGLLQVEGRVGRVEGLPGFADGRFWVQDPASAWMTDLVPASARRVLDAAAAPGGKTLRLATRGRDVVAADIDAARLDLLRGSLQRLRLSLPLVQHDWTQGPLPAIGRFDAVLIDAPCTGLGVVRRHPEIRWRRTAFDPARAAERQQRILAAAAEHIMPDGCVVYVVCSPEPEEGPEVIRAFLDQHPGWRIDEARSTAPPTGDEDAFYGARLVRS